MRRHLQAPGPVSHSHVRKDYGCPLRIYDSGDSCDRYTIFPPRSGRAMARYRYADGTWRCLCVDGAHVTRFQLRPTDSRNGDRITWNELPPAVQAALRASFLAEYCPPLVTP